MLQMVWEIYIGYKMHAIEKLIINILNCNHSLQREWMRIESKIVLYPKKLDLCFYAEIVLGLHDIIYFFAVKKKYI